MKAKYDVVIIGAGPGGTSCALSLLQKGVQPLIVEKAQFPRYHIGESLTGLAGQALRQLGLEPAMKAGKFPIKYGVHVYGAGGKNRFWIPAQQPDGNGQLQPVATWQVRRSDFDNMLLEAVLERGGEMLQAEAVTPVVEDNEIKGLRLRLASGEIHSVSTPMIVDASGQSTFLANKSNLTGRKVVGHYDKQVAIFSQVAGAIRDPGPAAGDTHIFYRQKHHWAWFIPITDELVSVGIVTPTGYFKEQGLTREAFLKQELRALNPALSERLPNLDFVVPVRAITDYSYRVADFAGPGYICVGDAHRFIDPIFSFGVHFALHEGIFAAQTIISYLEKPDGRHSALFKAYQTRVERGQDVIQDMLDCFWEYPVAFLIFAHYQYREELVQLFGGNIYDESVEHLPVVKAIQGLLRPQALQD
jgi:1H-pyrrole-2-carbonyl-[peptidyl-carrier protein] brominase